jgi:putative ATP-dependent endonuclease of OLD family
MYLSTLKLWNFRKFGATGALDLESPHQTVFFQKGVNLLVGENDSGKSAIIDAIKLVLKTHSTDWIRVEWEDFHKDSGRFRVECLFEGLEDDNEAKNFTEWLGWTGEGVEARPYLRLILDVTRNEDRVLGADVRAGADEVGHILTAEAREKLRLTYLKPLRDAKSELIPRRNSRLSQILLSHEAFRGKHETHSFVGMFRRVNTSVEAYFQGRDSEGQELGEEHLHGRALKEVIDRYLRQFSQNRSSLRMAETDLKSILESLCLLFEDGYNLGLGSHNLLSIASELVHLQKANWDGLRLGLIEEIEAHLHPQVQLQVMETIQKEAADVQLIFTTHSPNISAKISLSRLILCQQGKVFSMGSDHTLLGPTDYRYLERFLDVTRANLFFARGVILVEGWAEELILPALAKKVAVNLVERGVSIVNVGSLAFLRYAKIFRRREGPAMEIPVSVVTDVDVRPVEAGATKEVTDPGNPATMLAVPLTQEEINTMIGAERVKRAAKYDGNPVRTFVSPYWTLEYCIALSEKLRVILYKSVLEALREQKVDEGVSRLNSYDAVIADVASCFNAWTDSDELIAYRIYRHILDGDTALDVAKDAISKTMIAQRFAENLAAEDVRELETESSILYLINAIKYAAGI